MKKFFTFIVAAMTAMSSFATDYTDELVVTVNGVTSPAQETTISLTKNEDNSYDFLLKDFSFSGIKIGNITMKSVPSTTFNNVTYIFGTKKVHVNLGGVMPMNLPVTLRGELRGDKFYAAMDIFVQPLSQNVNVKFGNGGYQIPNSGFEDYRLEAFKMMDMTTYQQIDMNAPEPLYWHSFASAEGELKSAATAFTPAHTDSAIVARPKSNGTKSLLLSSQVVLGYIPANGTITTGRMNCGSSDAADTQNNAHLDLSSTDTDSNNDPFYTVMNGQPDSVAVWVAFKQGSPIPLENDTLTNHPYATLNAVITDGTYYQDPEDKEYTNKLSQAQDKEIAATYTHSGAPTEKDWKRIAVPFKMIDDKVNGKAILLTISTNADPGKGGSNDTLYVDDLDLIYNTPKVTELYYDGKKLNYTSASDDVVVSGDKKQVVDPTKFSVTVEGAIGAKVVPFISQDGDDVKATVYVSNYDLTMPAITGASAKETNPITVTFTNATTGISAIDINNTKQNDNGPVEIYNISGQRVNNMQPGQVYIVKKGGKTYKVSK